MTGRPAWSEYISDIQGIADLQKIEKLHMREGENKETVIDGEVKKILRSRLRNEYLLYNFVTQHLRKQVIQCAAN